MATDLKTIRKKDMQKLRGKMDGSEGFMSAHQIKKVRTREREIPEWTLNNKEVQKIILLSFPNWRTNEIQRERAGRWVMLIHLYYRARLSGTQVAQEMDTSLNVVKTLLKSIRRVSKGLRADNSGPRTRKPVNS